MNKKIFTYPENFNGQIIALLPGTKPLAQNPRWVSLMMPNIVTSLFMYKAHSDSPYLFMSWSKVASGSSASY